MEFTSFAIQILRQSSISSAAHIENSEMIWHISHTCRWLADMTWDLQVSYRTNSWRPYRTDFAISEDTKSIPVVKCIEPLVSTPGVSREPADPMSMSGSTVTQIAPQTIDCIYWIFIDCNDSLDCQLRDKHVLMTCFQLYLNSCISEFPHVADRVKKCFALASEVTGFSCQSPYFGSCCSTSRQNIFQIKLSILKNSHFRHRNVNGSVTRYWEMQVNSSFHFLLHLLSIFLGIKQKIVVYQFAAKSWGFFFCVCGVGVFLFVCLNDVVT